MKCRRKMSIEAADDAKVPLNSPLFRRWRGLDVRITVLVVVRRGHWTGSH